MGAWGAGLYQDDVSCDVKEGYRDWLSVGKSNEEATNIMIEYNRDFIEDEEDGPVFWLALADTQWKCGRLMKEVKEEALNQMDNNLKRWKEEGTREYNKRKKVLENLKERLESPQPPEKKIKKLKLSKAYWKVGDVLR